MEEVEAITQGDPGGGLPFDVILDDVPESNINYTALGDMTLAMMSRAGNELALKELQRRGLIS
jgi:hypothetical protein